MNQYTVTVVMSTFNGEKYIEEQIDSILNQEGVDLKLYIRDDGSTDETRQILQQYEKNNKVAVDYGDNIGYAKSFIKALKDAPESDYYAFSDQDDVWFKDKLVNTIKLIDSNDKFALAFQNCFVTDERLENKRLHYQINREVPFYGMSFTLSVCSGFLMVFDSYLRDLAIIDVDVPISHDMWVSSLASYVGVVRFGNETTALHRKTNVSVTNQPKKVLKHRLQSIWIDNGQNISCARIVLDNFGELITDEDKKNMLYDLINYRNDRNCRKRLIQNSNMRYPSRLGKTVICAKILLKKF